MDKMKLIMRMLDEIETSLKKLSGSTLQPEFRKKTLTEKAEILNKMANLRGKLEMGTQIMKILGGF